MLLLASITLPNVVFYALAAALMFTVGRLLFKVDTRMENLKRDAIGMSQLTEQAGLKLTSGLLEDVAVGDLTGAFQHGREILRTLRDEDQREAALKVFLSKQLDLRLKDPAKREEFLTELEKRLGVEVPRPDNVM